MKSQALTTARLVLRNLTTADVGERYLGWLRDREVIRFLEIRFSSHTLESTCDFIDSVNSSADSILFGLFLRDSGKHIGNIKLGPINPHHRRADIGLMLGDREEWGKGYASEAIDALTGFGFEQLGLSKISAGCYEDNVGSLKAFLKVGFEQEARLPNHWNADGRAQAELLLGMSREAHDRRKGRQSNRYGSVKSLTFIGGGELMLQVAQHAQRLGYRVGVLLAPRHAGEILSDGKTSIGAACRARDFDFAVVDDINQWEALAAFPTTGPTALALCFGPAWVFSAQVISRFGAGMVNFNGIPIPHYLGGAHYTWQILHGNRSGGCFLQDITIRVDQGDVLRHEYFDLPASATNPNDYFAANSDAALAFLKAALEDMKSDQPFPRTPYESLNARRLYFPRLYTKENAYVDWRWSGDEIARFCNAFDEPYLGAATFWRGAEVRLKNVRFEALPVGFHPFTSGLVVRKHKGAIWVATHDGLLALGDATAASGSSVLADMREGDRLVTPDERLAHALNFSPRFTAQGVASKN